MEYYFSESSMILGNRCYKDIYIFFQTFIDLFILRYTRASLVLHVEGNVLFFYY